MSALRLLVYDRTAGALGAAWWAGKVLYRGLGRLDAGFGAASWAEALDWLGSHGGDAPLAEVQFWGHGRWGLARVGREALDVDAVLDEGHPHRARLHRVARRLLPGDEGLWWFRTCETFGTEVGQRFARAWTRALGCRAAGHTYVIGVWQSGLHSLLPGEEPTWSPREGLGPPGPDGRAASLALGSGPRAPNTITCFHGKVPPGF